MSKHGSILSRILIPILFVVIVVYLVLSAWAGLRNPYRFVSAYVDTMENSTPATGWVVRREQPVAGGQGIVQLRREQNEKVGKGQEVAVVYQDEGYIDNQEELVITAADLGILQYATYEASPTGAVLEDQLLGAMTSLRSAASSGNFTELSEQTSNFRKLVLRREYLVSSQAADEMIHAMWALEERYEELQSYQAGAATIRAEVSGVFSSHLDGYETLLTPEDLTGIGPDGLAAFSQLTPLSDGGYLGKLVTSTEWYYAAVLPGKYAGNFTVGRDVKIHFDALSTILTMNIYSVGEVQEEQLVVLFRSTRDVDRADELRQESSRIVFRSSTGIRVPKEALRVDEEGTIGVYVASGHNASFRPVELLTEDETSYLVSPVSSGVTDTNVLRVGDEVIVSSVELYNGKVVR